MKRIILLCAIFFMSISSACSDKINLEGIKVNLIGRKTRVTFLFDKEVAYTTNKLEDPFRIMMDFVEKVSCSFEKVKVFNMGFVKNVRSFFVDDSNDLYILDVCVIELDRKCAVDMFWSGPALHIDFVDIEVIEREKKEELINQAKIKMAQELYKEGLVFMEEEKYALARKKFLASMQADYSFKIPVDDIRRCEKLLNKKNKKIKKTAHDFEKEMASRLKKESKIAAALEKEIVQEKKAWDFEIIIINKLLTKEQNKNEIFNLKLKLFHAYFNMKKYPEQIILGEELLLQDSIENRLDQKKLKWKNIMSQYYNSRRTKGLYNPNSKELFKLSRSKIDLFLAS